MAVEANFYNSIVHVPYLIFFLSDQISCVLLAAMGKVEALHFNRSIGVKFRFIANSKWGSCGVPKG